MPIEIALTDGTKIPFDDTVNNFTDITPTSGWVYINEGDGTPKRYINAANIVYVIEVEEPEGPRVDVFGNRLL